MIHLYFSDLENPKLIQVKEKFHLEDLIEEASTKFYVNVDDNKLDQTTKDIINALIKYDSKMSEIIELFHDKMYYIILNAGQDYLDYDNYIKFLRIYINCLGNIINLKDVNFFFSDEKPDKDNNITLGASTTEKTIYLNKAFVSRIYNRKTSCLLLINTIIHELVHSRITNDLSTCQIDKHLNNTIEFCITRACRLLSEFYEYDLYKGDNYRYNYEEANAINDAKGYVERLITSLGPLISPKDINSYKEKMYINFRNSNETIYTMNFKDAFFISLLRIVLSGLIFNGTFAMIYSLVGGLLSFAVMCIFKKFDKFTPIGVSAFGGTIHNLGQIIVAGIVMNTYRIIYYFPILMLSGLITGIINGIIADIIIKRWKKPAY